jgi:hypothetical protein
MVATGLVLNTRADLTGYVLKLHRYIFVVNIVVPVQLTTLKVAYRHNFQVGTGAIWFSTSWNRGNFI